jgi:hypothetical protein
MKRLALVALVLVGFGCGDAGSLSDGRDAGVASEPDAEVVADAQTEVAPSPCVAPYARRAYYPLDEVYCGPTDGTYVDNPCVGALPVSWGGEGVVRCGTPDGGVK